VGGVTDGAVPGWDIDIGFVAEGRIGDRSGAGTFELDVGSDTAGTFNTAQFNWVNNTSYAFSLIYDGTTATFTVGGTAVSYNAFAVSDEFDGLAIRTSAYEGQSVLFTGLDLNGTSIGSFSNISTATGSNRDVVWLLLSDFGDLTGGFILTGNVSLAWTLNPDPNLNQSKLAFQIKGSDAPVVPIPGAVWLFASGLIGLVVIRRKTKR
jgi:hypothetical protein